tara:strand:- start:687 stop:1379 length:693 start_codon:yes stop_codon:yes gene_type:complete
MKLKIALVLCAGYGKRLKPLTLKKPKPLISVKNINLLQNTLNLLKLLDIEKIKINTFYLEKQIIDFVSKNEMNAKIEIVKDGDKILNTGGGILNLMKSSDENNFIVFNPDTIWSSDHAKEINDMIRFYKNNSLNNLLLVVNKNKSFDKRFKGDFELKEQKLLKQKKNNFIFTGCQIINKKVFENNKEKYFSISKIWDQKIKDKTLFGYESKLPFIHLTDMEIYNRLIKNN